MPKKLCNEKAVSVLEFTGLAVLVAMWKGYSHPAFIDAVNLLDEARQHLSGVPQVHSTGEYEIALDQFRRPKPAPPAPSKDDPIDVIEQTLRDEDAHPAIAEPSSFPVFRSTCLFIITGEKDRRRRVPILLRAGVKESGDKIHSVQEFRALAYRIVRHLRKFGAEYPRQRRTPPSRSERGRFVKASVQRGNHGRVKKITNRDEKGQIIKNLKPS